MGFINAKLDFTVLIVFRVFIADVVQKLVFQDEEGNTISETDASSVGKVIQVRFRSLY